jgi:hypothetical protein
VAGGVGDAVGLRTEGGAGSLPGGGLGSELVGDEEWGADLRALLLGDGEQPDSQLWPTVGGLDACE